MKSQKTLKNLVPVFIVLVLMCILFLILSAVKMNKYTTQIVSDIETQYMMEMSGRVSKNFEMALTLNFSYMSEVTMKLSNNHDHFNESRDTYDYLKKYAEEHSFLSFGLCCEHGEIETLYGDDVSMLYPENFLGAIQHDERRVGTGATSSGETVILLGIPYSAPMHNSHESICFTAALPLEYFKDTLVLDGKDGLFYTHLIRKDGSFVIKSGDVVRDNYFDRIRDLFDSKKAGMDAQTFIDELSYAIENGERFSSIVYVENERRFLFCSHLPNSKWYMVIIVPYGYLDVGITNLSNMWGVIVAISSVMLVVTFIYLFISYYRISKQQLKEITKAREDALEATRAKSEFLSNMSHDIRTPMNAIMGMTTIAIANIDNKSQLTDCLKKISMSCRHLLGLINDILDMSKIESGKMTLTMEAISLRETAENLVNITQLQIKEKQQSFDVFIHDIKHENVYCDSVRLNQVLLNLLSNAMKFTPSGGKISLTLREEASPLGSKYMRIHLYVRDTGIGMSEEFQKNIFDSFSREDNLRVQKTEGTGLGMAITKFIVDKMNGSIEVKSERGKGSEFHVTFDLEIAEEMEFDMILPPMNILIVDDDLELCKSAAKSLDEMGINAEWVLDGRSAVRSVNEKHSSGNDYSIIMLDWKMEDMDGIETAREIRRQAGGDIPILMISAYDWSDIENEAREAGITGFISKPLFKSTMYYSIKHMMSPDNSVPVNDASIDLSGRRILIAEDNDLNWEIAEVLFSNFGPDVERAENGKICVEKFSASDIGYYDAILMDIRMPVMTGYEAARAIRAIDREDSDIPIIAMSADAFSEDVQKSLDSGMNAHVAKPIDPVMSAKIIDNLINKKNKLLQK